LVEQICHGNMSTRLPLTDGGAHKSRIVLLI